MIDHLLPFLSKGDIVIDGGNSLFTDSNRRTKDLAAKRNSSSAPAFPAAKKVLASVHRSCQEAIPKHGRM